MTLPDEVGFASAGGIDGEGDEEDLLIGFHLQYQIGHTMVNIVIMAVNREGSEATEDILIEELDRVSYEDEDESFSDSTAASERIDIVSDKIQAWVEKQCASTLVDLVKEMKSQRSPAISSQQTLHEYLDLTIVNLQLKTVNGKVLIERHGQNPPSWPTHLNLGDVQGMKVELTKHVDLPSYSAGDAIIKDKTQIPKVIINGDTARCKLNVNRGSTRREHQTYLQIKEAGLDHLRFPAFRGYVDNIAGTSCIGLLLQDIEAKYSTLDEALCNPWCGSPKIDREFPPPELRAKWASQIQEMLDQLHANNIIWGDAKPANMLIDTNDDLWILDFGGGFTPPWKYAHDAETVEGDRKALRLILDYLRTGQQPKL